MGLRVQLFGSFQLWRNDELIQPEAWRGHKAQALFKILLTEPGRPFTQDQLIDWLWPDTDPDKARHNLRSLITRVRRILEPELKRGPQSQYILTRPSGYGFNAQADCVIDSQAFEGHLNQARQLESKDQFEGAIQEYQQAVALHQGEFLAEDRYEDWAIPHSERWQQIYLDALSQLAECHARLGQYRRAIARCNQILTVESYREGTYRLLMLYHYLNGDPDQAIRIYERFRTLLQQELNTEPLPETQQLYQQILDREILGIDDLYRPVSVVERTPIPTLLKRVPFVSREQEYGELVSHLEEVKNGSGRMVLVFGEAGIGKTRLVEELIRYGQHQHRVRALEGRCHELNMSLSYQPLIDAIREELPRLAHTPEVLQPINPLWLAEVADLVPELRDLVPDLPDNSSLPLELKRNYLFEGLTQFLVGLAQAEGLLVLFLDDLHWVDPSTLDFLALFCARLVNYPILIVGTYRSEEVEEVHPLIKLIQHGERQGVLHRYELDHLSEQAVDQLLSEMFPQFDRSFRERIYQETQGNPFFIVAVLQHLFEEGLLQVGEDGTWKSTVEKIPTEDRARALMFPEMVKGVIQRRLMRLKAEERRLLQLAAVIGDRFELELLERAQGEAPRATLATLETLEGLTQAQLLVEQADNGGYAFAFSHDKIWEVVYYDEMSEARRKWLHRQVGEALRQVYADRLEQYGGRIGKHYARAGDTVKAAEWYRRGRAYRQALEAYKIVLQEATKQEEHAELLYKIGYMYELLGEYEQAIEYYMKSNDISESLGNRAGVARAYHHIGWDYYRLGRLEQARECLTVSRKMAQELEDRLLLARTDLRLGPIDWKEGQLEEARIRFEDSRRIFSELGERRWEAQAVGNLGLIYRTMGDLDRALSYYRKAMEIQKKIGDLNGLLYAYNNLGEVYHRLGDHSQAVHYYERLAQLAQDTEHKRMLSIAYSGLADAYLALGESRRALEYALKAWQVAQEIGPGFELGVSCRVLGEVRLVLGDAARAKACFEQSIPLLEEVKEDEELAKARHGHELALSRLGTDS
ncbi:MAG: tetratricopeptide repeat protein [Candidatus Bipolaricaulia bacterium]